MRRLLSIILLAVFPGLASTVFAAPAPYTEGQHYLVVPKPGAPADPHRVTVEEFFWFGCPHCYELEPALDSWRHKLPADVAFQFVPNSLGRENGVVHEQAFFIAKELGIEERIHQPLFDALVRDQKPLNTLPAIRDFFVKTTGIKPEAFDGLAGSFMIDGEMRRADEAAVDYRVLGTPTLVVDGKYTTTVGMPGYHGAATVDAANAEMLAITSFLIDKVRAERGLAK